MYSDAAKSASKGFGVYCNKQWVAKKWPTGFIQNCDPSIEYLELYRVTTAVLLWIKNFNNRRICLFTDNDSVKNMINHTTASCKNCMVLIRLIVLESLMWNVRIFAKFVRSKNNSKADALSRTQFERFRRLDENMDIEATDMPEKIWPIEKIWVN